MIITKEQAVLCAEFMLDEDRWDVVIPWAVARVLAAYERNPHNASIQWDLANVLTGWLDNDREACMALLGPGLEP